MYQTGGSSNGPGSGADTSSERSDGSVPPETGSPDTGTDVADGESTPIAQQFEGYWYTLDGEGTFDCGDEPFAIDSGPEGEITDAEDGAFAFELIDVDCSYTFDLDGRTATVRDPGECEAENGTVQPLEWSLTLSKDGERIDQEYRDEVASGSGSSAETCRTEWSGTLEPGPGPKAYVDSFTGTWSYAGESASGTYSCDGEGFLAPVLSEDNFVPDALEITKGAEADLSILEKEVECEWSAPVQFREAELSEGATCRPPQFNEFLSENEDFVRTVTRSTYQLGEEGQEITHTYEGTVELTSPDRPDEECDESWSLTYERQ